MLIYLTQTASNGPIKLQFSEW